MQYLSALRAGKGREDGLDALTRSMVQLPIYIERLLGGGRDIALVLLPMLNDLRAARGEPLLSEGTLLLLNLSPQRRAKGECANGSGEDPVSLPNGCGRSSSLRCSAGSRAATRKRHLETLAGVAPHWRIRQLAMTCTSSGGSSVASSSRCRTAASKHPSR